MAQQQPKLVEIFSDILKAAGRMEAMVGDVLDICLAEAGALVPRLISLDFSALVQDQVDLQSRTVGLRNSSIHFKKPPTALFALLDHLLIGRLITNLFDNALKFSPPNSSIDIELFQEGSMVELTVCDQGPAILQKDAERIFQSRHQGVGVKPGSGYGLGLAFCRMAAEAHGGSIALSQSTGPGNCFTLSLPLPR